MSDSGRTRKPLGHLSQQRQKRRTSALYNRDLNLNIKWEGKFSKENHVIAQDCQPTTEELNYSDASEGLTSRKTNHQGPESDEPGSADAAESEERSTADDLGIPAQKPIERNSSARPSCCDCDVEHMKRSEAENQKRFNQLESKLKKLLFMMHDLHERQVVCVPTFKGQKSMVISPATTIEELQKLSDHPHLVEIMKMCIGKSSRDTIRKILKNCMTKELAQKYSYTGLGLLRRREKLAFGDHKLCRFILENAASFQLSSSRKEVINDIKLCLRAKRDWYGGRQNRVAPPHQQDAALAALGQHQQDTAPAAPGPQQQVVSAAPALQAQL